MSLWRLVDVVAIRPFFDRNCPGDIVLSMDGIDAARDKSLCLLDCDGTLMDSTWWQTRCHYSEDDTVAAVFFFRNPAYGVPDCDDTWEGDGMGTSEVGGKEAERGD